MSKLFTSYYGNKKINPKINKVAISRSQPAIVGLTTFQDLYPTEDMLRRYKDGLLSEDEYEIEYRERVLSQLDPDETYERLTVKGDAVLLCYEKSEDFCHRHIVAAWFEENGFICDEYSIEKHLGFTINI